MGVTLACELWVAAKSCGFTRKKIFANYGRFCRIFGERSLKFAVG